jgi:hypothetical protein
MKNFIKSDWFRCIAVLLALAVVLGGTLAILNDVLYVSPEERTARAIKKIYGENKEYTVVLDQDGGFTCEYGSIDKIYQVGEDTLFKATGNNGYKNGTISLWIKVINDNGNDIIDKVVMDGYDKQTLMSKFTDKYYKGFLTDITAAINNGEFFSPKSDATGLKNPMSGATKSANAICNAVNCVIFYIAQGGLA